MGAHNIVRVDRLLARAQGGASPAAAESALVHSPRGTSGSGRLRRARGGSPTKVLLVTRGAPVIHRRRCALGPTLVIDLTVVPAVGHALAIAERGRFQVVLVEQRCCKDLHYLSALRRVARGSVLVLPTAQARHLRSWVERWVRGRLPDCLDLQAVRLARMVRVALWGLPRRAGLAANEDAQSR